MSLDYDTCICGAPVAVTESALREQGLIVGCRTCDWTGNAPEEDHPLRQRRKRCRICGARGCNGARHDLPDRLTKHLQQPTKEPTMKITLTTNDDRTLAAKLPHPDSTCVEISEACSKCDSRLVFGRDQTHDHDTYVAPAFCVGCGNGRGTLRVKVDTLFGIEEDERVLHGRWRVY